MDHLRKFLGVGGEIAADKVQPHRQL